VDFTDITYRVHGSTAIIVLDRPDQLNAYTPAMGAEIIEALDLAEADDDVRAIIVTGAGRGFCAGADISGGGSRFDYEHDDETPRRDGGGVVALRMYECLKPLIAAINGPAVGIGLTMTLPMDFRIASTDAKLGFVFARRGIVMEACSSWFLPRIVGMTKALDWVTSGRLFTAEEGLQSGLLTSVHPPDELFSASLEVAEDIGRNCAPISVAINRQMLWRMIGVDHPMYAHRIDSRAMTEIGRSVDAREGVEAFLERRDPEFSLRPSVDMPSFYPWSQDPEFE
jgi:enoyl-CoA hydratase/carnithine racemase